MNHYISLKLVINYHRFFISKIDSRERSRILLVGVTIRRSRNDALSLLRLVLRSNLVEKFEIGAGRFLSRHSLSSLLIFSFSLDSLFGAAVVKIGRMFNGFRRLYLSYFLRVAALN